MGISRVSRVFGGGTAMAWRAPGSVYLTKSVLPYIAEAGLARLHRAQKPFSLTYMQLSQVISAVQYAWHLAAEVLSSPGLPLTSRSGPVEAAIAWFLDAVYTDLAACSRKTIACV